MNSAPNPKQADPYDVAVAVLQEACEQIGRADERLAPMDEQISRLELEAAYYPSDQQQRPYVQGLRSSRGRLALRGIVGLLLAAGICVAAFAWQSYGDAAKLIIDQWAPQPISISSLLRARQELPAQSSPTPVDVAIADAALPQPAPPAQATPQRVPPTAAPMSPELTDWFQKTARDLANLEQGIKQLRASQDQMVRNNAELAERLKATQAQMARDNAAVAEQLKTALTQAARDNAALAEQFKAAQAQMARDTANAAEQLKASQEQMAGLIAKEQHLQPRASAPPQRPTAIARRKPVPTPSSTQTQTRAQPRASKPEQQ